MHLVYCHWIGAVNLLLSTLLPPSQANPTVAPPARALYGGGLLRIWADTIYARVMAYRETPESKEAVLSLGRTIAANRKMPAEPELLNILPQAVDSDWKLRKDRIGYFRSHLVLNSLYYLSHQNILNLDHSTEAVTAPYENISDAENAKTRSSPVCEVCHCRRKHEKPWIIFTTHIFMSIKKNLIQASPISTRIFSTLRMVG